MKNMLVLYFKKKKLIAELTRLFKNDAKKFNGLYKGIYQVAEEGNKKKLKALDEFYDRLSYLGGYGRLIEMLRPFFPVKSKSIKNTEKLSGIILTAASKANIYHTDIDDIIVLNNENTRDYQDWDGDEVYEGDTVRIVLPAWYQEKTLLEQGYCVLESPKE